MPLDDGERGRLGRLRAGQHLLRERRAVVGAVRLVADERDGAGVAEAAQLLGGAQPGEGGPDDDDVVEAHGRRVRRRSLSPRS